MKRSIPLFFAAVLFGVAGIYSLFADNNGIPIAQNQFIDEWSDVQPQPLQQQIDPGHRRPQLNAAPPNIAPDALPQNRQPSVSEKQKRKYRIQIICERSRQVPAVIQPNNNLGTQYTLQSVDETNLATAQNQIYDEEPAAHVWLYCDEIEMKTAKQTEAGKSTGYDLKIAGPFVVESPGLSIRGMGLEVQEGEMSFTNGKIKSGGFVLAVEKCKLPFAIRSLQIDSMGQQQEAAPAPIVAY